jgi:hypothetical protein
MSAVEKKNDATSGKTALELLEEDDEFEVLPKMCTWFNLTLFTWHGFNTYRSLRAPTGRICRDKQRARSCFKMTGRMIMRMTTSLSN